MCERDGRIAGGARPSLVAFAFYFYSAARGSRGAGGEALCFVILVFIVQLCYGLFIYTNIIEVKTLFVCLNALNLRNRGSS